MHALDDLKSLLGLTWRPDSPLITIYSPLGSARLNYCCAFIFNHVLQVNYRIVHQSAHLKEDSGALINYSAEDIPGALQVIPATLLFETGVSPRKPKPVIKNERIYFYESEQGFHMDIFAAVFYFISRYEEWQDFTPDNHGRFEAAESLLFRNGFHMKPVVEEWILELRAALELLYRDLEFPAREFRVLSTIDVDNLFAYKSKGVLRTLAASVKDLLRRDLPNLRERWLVIRGKKADPLDIYGDVSAFCQRNGIPLICFFLFRTGTRFDRTVDPRSGAFAQVFDTLSSNNALIGIHPSYQAAFAKGQLAFELAQFRRRARREVVLSRQHFLRFDICSTPALLLANGILADFTMGFASEPGFRAGTSIPFYYYDFNLESRSRLLFVPFCAMDGVWSVYKDNGPDQAMHDLSELAASLRSVNGNFITVFHERSFYDHLYPGFGSLYKKLHSRLKGQ